MRGLLLTFLLLSAMPVMRAQAGYELLAEFPRPGTQPMAALLAAGDGNWYTTTTQGGAMGQGAVIQVTPAGAVTLVHSFSGAGGAAPTAGLAAAADGTLYGVTSGGGAGFGTAFKVTAGGAFTLLHSFTGTGGSVPQQLVRHTDGNFYGTAQAGGTAGWGTVFRLTSAGVITTLVEFSGTTGAVKGATPLGPLTFSGNTLYGVTRDGGAGGLGVVFSVTTGGTYALMAEFTGTAGAKPGANPAGGLFLNTDGALYGTTEFGGANDFGTAFRITTGGAFTGLRSFDDPSGSQPAGTLARGADGLLYGGTAAGGTSGFGTLFKITTGGTHTVLANFTATTGAVPGATPRGGVIAGGDGNFYAATSAGGPANAGVICRVSPAGVYAGVANLSLTLGWIPSGAPVADGADFLFPMNSGGSGGGGALVRLTASGAVTLAAPLGGTAGSNPTGALVKSGANFFGVAARGGASDRGSVFKFSGAAATVLSPGTTSGGGLPEGPLTVGSDGSFFGTAREGGASSRGSLYKVSAAGVRTRLLSFTGTTGTVKGNRPRGTLALAANTSYYGLTETGGAADMGTLFRMSAAGTFTTLAEFAATGPRLPLGGLTLAPDGNLYSTTSRGGSADGGTLLRVVPGTNTWSTLADFTAATGIRPAGSLLTDTGGAIYGLSTAGGPAGQGTLWKFTPAGGLEALISFTGTAGAAPGSGSFLDGTTLLSGGVTIAADGILYGVTPGGGSGGGGTVFRYTWQTPLQSWKLTHLGDANAPDLGDPDNDGIATLVEYALIMQPGQADAAQLPAVSTSTIGALQLTVPRDPARNDVTTTIEASETLAGPWLTLAVSASGAPFTGPGYVSGDSTGGGLKSALIRDTATPSTAPRRFLRTRVSR